MHVLTDTEMQRFVRATGVVGALLLVAGILGLGLWAVSLGGLLLVLAGLGILAAVEGRELDETPAAAVRQPVAAGRTTSAPDAERPADDRDLSSRPGQGASASLDHPTDGEGPTPSSGPAVVDVSPAGPAKAMLSPLERLAMALPPGALADRQPAPSPAEPSPPDPVPDAGDAPVELSAAPPLVVDLRDDASERTEPAPATSPEAVEPPSVEPTEEPGPEPALVTFRLPRSVGAQAATVVGEFNGWSPDAHPMAPEDDAFVARIPLEPGRAYRYRYLLDGERWENDWWADAYVPNEYGGDDSLIDLRR